MEQNNKEYKFYCRAIQSSLKLFKYYLINRLDFLYKSNYQISQKKREFYYSNTRGDIKKMVICFYTYVAKAPEGDIDSETIFNVIDNR